MNLDPENYIHLKQLGGSVFDKVIDDLFYSQLISRDTTYDLILDLACGPGPQTQSLASKVKHNKIISADIDPDMIAFAKKENKCPSIEYLVQDMTLNWDHLDPMLKELEGKTPFINCCGILLWPVMKDRLIENCARLLEGGSPLFISGVLLPDLAHKVSEEFRSKTNIEWLSVGSQINYLSRMLIQNGFKIIKMDINIQEWLRDEQMCHDLKVFGGYQRHFKCNNSCEYEGLLNEFFNYTFDALLNPSSQQLNSKAWNEILHKEFDVNKTYLLSIPYVAFYCNKI